MVSFSELVTDLKKHMYVVIGGLALLSVGYAFGRYATPDKVVVTEKTKVVETEKVVTQVKTEIQKVYISDSKKHTHTEEYEVKHPDGTDEKKTTTDENLDTVVHEQDIRYVERWNERVVEKEIFKEREKLVLKDSPSWHFGVMAGLGLPQALGNTADGYKLLPSLGPLILGAELNKRLLGPLDVGVWGLSNGVVGVSVGLKF